MLDIDFFKKINDTNGHDAGDKALKELSTTCKNLLRKTDTIGRFGGEEFIVVLPETNLDNAITLAEKIRSAIKQLKIAYKNEIITLSVSLGAATLHANETESSTLLKRVDKALYAAKESGRNKVVSEDTLL